MRTKIIVFTALSFSLMVGSFFTSCDSCGVLGNCYKPKNSDNLNGPLSRQCPGPAGAAQVFSSANTSPESVNVFAFKKLVLDLDPGVASAAHIDQIDQNFSAHSEFVLNFDAHCLKTHGPANELGEWALDQNPDSFVDELNFKALSLSLPRPMMESELERLANQDQCLMGVGRRFFYKAQQTADSLFNDTLVSNQTHLDKIGFGPMYNGFLQPNLGTLGLDVTVAVIDTGVDYGHADLSSKLYSFSLGPSQAPVYDVVTGSFISSSAEGDIDYSLGHGSHVAGLIGAASNNSSGVVGAAPFRVNIMAVRPFAYYCGSGPYVACTFNAILGSNTDGSPNYQCRDSSNTLVSCQFGALTEKVVDAINFSVQNGAKVLNLSLGVDQNSNADDASYLSALQSATNAGTVVVMAAGNAGKSYGSTFSNLPGKYGAQVWGAINVGAIDTYNSQKSLYSNYNPAFVEMAAPGSYRSFTNGSTEGLYSTLARHITSVNRGCPLSMPQGYGCRAGTSQATPLVAAGAALAVMMYRSVYANEPSAFTIEDILRLAATKDPNLSNYFLNGNILNLQNLQATVTNYCSSQ